MKKHKGMEVESITKDFLALCYRRTPIHIEHVQAREIVLPQEPQPIQKSFLKERME